MIESEFHLANKSQGTVIFWPCWLGNYKFPFYEIPQEEILNRGYSLLLYNPPGHGNSSGTFEPARACEALRDLVESLSLRGKPIIGVSHSGGSVCLMRSAKLIPMEKIFLFAPVPDSKQSIEYMYRSKTIGEFARVLTGPEGQNINHLDMLKEPSWLDPRVWGQKKWREQLDYPYVTHFGTKFESMGRTIEATLIPSQSGWEELNLLKNKLNITLAQSDAWFPQDLLTQKLKSLKIAFEILPEGSSHFLNGYWGECWKKVLDSF